MCNCIEEMNAALEPHNTCLDVPCRINLSSGEPLPARILLSVCKIDPKKRAQLPVLFAAFCPICGQKYEE